MSRPQKKCKCLEKRRAMDSKARFDKKHSMFKKRQSQQKHCFTEPTLSNELLDVLLITESLGCDTVNIVSSPDGTHEVFEEIPYELERPSVISSNLKLEEKPRISFKNGCICNKHKKSAAISDKLASPEDITKYFNLQEILMKQTVREKEDSIFVASHCAFDDDKADLQYRSVSRTGNNYEPHTCACGENDGSQICKCTKPHMTARYARDNYTSSFDVALEEGNNLGSQEYMSRETFVKFNVSTESSESEENDVRKSSLESSKASMQSKESAHNKPIVARPCTCNKTCRKPQESAVSIIYSRSDTTFVLQPKGVPLQLQEFEYNDTSYEYQASKDSSKVNIAKCTNYVKPVVAVQKPTCRDISPQTKDTCQTPPTEPPTTDLTPERVCHDTNIQGTKKISSQTVSFKASHISIEAIDMELLLIQQAEPCECICECARQEKISLTSSVLPVEKSSSYFDCPCRHEEQEYDKQLTCEPCIKESTPIAPICKKPILKIEPEPITKPDSGIIECKAEPIAVPEPVLKVDEPIKPEPIISEPRIPEPEPIIHEPEPIIPEPEPIIPEPLPIKAEPVPIISKEVPLKVSEPEVVTPPSPPISSSDDGSPFWKNPAFQLASFCLCHMLIRKYRLRCLEIFDW